MTGLCKGGNEPPGSLKANELVHNSNNNSSNNNNNIILYESITIALDVFILDVQS